MYRIQIALAEIQIKRDMLIPYTYRDIARKYNVCEATLRYYVKKYGDQQPRLDHFFLDMNSSTRVGCPFIRNFFAKKWCFCASLPIYRRGSP